MQKKEVNCKDQLEGTYGSMYIAKESYEKPLKHIFNHFYEIETNVEK